MHYTKPLEERISDVAESSNGEYGAEKPDDDLLASLSICYMPCVTHRETRVENAGWKSKKRGIWQGLVATDLTSLDVDASEVFLQTAKLLNAEHVHIYSESVEGIENVLKNLPPKLLITCSSLTVMGCRFSPLKLLIPIVNPGCGLRVYFHELDEEKPDAECRLGASVTVCYMPWMTHEEGESHDCFFFRKEGGGCTRKEVIQRTKKCDLLQESKLSELVYPDSVYTACTKVFLRLAEHLNAEHVHICLALVEGIESALKNLPPKLMITCSVLNVEACRFSFLKLLFPFVNRGCGLRIRTFDLGDDDEEAIDSAIFDSELVKAAPFLLISAECRISDGQLAYLKACWICIYFAPQISEEGLIRLIMQWVDGKRRINRIYLGHLLAVSEDMIYKVRRCKLIPESELIKTPFLKDFMEENFESGFRIGIRNKAGDLIVVNVSEDSCEIADPYSEDHPPFSYCWSMDPGDL